MNRSIDARSHEPEPRSEAGSGPSPDDGREVDNEAAMDALTASGWYQVKEHILRGLAHDTSGHAGTLPMLVDVLTGDPYGVGMDRPEALAHIRKESRRLQESARLLRLVTQRGGTAEAFGLNETVSDAADLHARHRGLEHRPFAFRPLPESVAVRSDPVLLLRLLLVVLADAGWQASNRSEAGRVVVSSDTENGVISVESRLDGRGHPAEAPVHAETLPFALRACEALGGELVVEEETDDGIRRVQLRLPRVGRGRATRED